MTSLEVYPPSLPLPNIYSGRPSGRYVLSRYGSSRHGRAAQGAHAPNACASASKVANRLGARE
jgi:hypothetical protein